MEDRTAAAVQGAHRRDPLAKAALIALRWFIATVLIATGVGKALDLRGFTEVIDSYRVLPEILLWPAAIAMTASELGIAIWLCSGRELRWAAAAAAALHLVFICWITVALLRELPIPNCGCFGVFWARPLTWATLVEDGIMLASCLALYATASRRYLLELRGFG